MCVQPVLSRSSGLGGLGKGEEEKQIKEHCEAEGETCGGIREELDGREQKTKAHCVHIGNCQAKII